MLNVNVTLPLQTYTHIVVCVFHRNLHCNIFIDVTLLLLPLPSKPASSSSWFKFELPHNYDSPTSLSYLKLKLIQNTKAQHISLGETSKPVKMEESTTIYYYLYIYLIIISVS
jgi:hypothetical protein